ncbi:MAG TPA: hypothetical protein VMI31_12580 [Fimbriimonadaceae bacterium]|nr:hypothetical protein [Fimbriimonadaceae bacterium]
MLAFAALVAAQFSGMRYLDDGVIRLGVDLDEGGSITYLSRKGGDNIVNSCDFGRQIQMSLYSGPVPYTPGGKQPSKDWTEIGWNPIQTGDCFGHPSRVLDCKTEADERGLHPSIYVKCIPMHWPLDNVPGECTYEEWISLDGDSVIVHDRMVNNREDKTQYPARGQELPAVYTNGVWYRLMSYTGDAPFIHAPLTELTLNPPKSTFPWVGYHATESWAALVDKDSNGVGIIEPGVVQFSGGFFGTPGSGGPKDGQTGYIAPNAVEILDHDITYDYSYFLVVGSLDRIRQFAYSHVPRPEPPIYLFLSDRQHWSYANCEDAGWPIKGELNVKLEKNDPQLVGPLGFWRAKDAPKLTIEAACSLGSPVAQVFWSRSDAPGFAESRTMSLRLIPDGQYHRYVIDLSESPEYHGVVDQLRFDPEPAGRPGDWIKIRSIAF